jgi:hypothetical protein
LTSRFDHGVPVPENTLNLTVGGFAAHPLGGALGPASASAAKRVHTRSDGSREHIGPVKREPSALLEALSATARELSPDRDPTEPSPEEPNSRLARRPLGGDQGVDV